jgi:hypothetical protein
LIKSDADLIVSGLLHDLKRDSKLSPGVTTVFQVTGYALLEFDDAYQLTSAGTLQRHGDDSHHRGERRGSPSSPIGWRASTTTSLSPANGRADVMLISVRSTSPCRRRSTSSGTPKRSRISPAVPEDFAVGDTYTAAQVRAELEALRHASRREGRSLSGSAIRSAPRARTSAASQLRLQLRAEATSRDTGRTARLAGIAEIQRYHRAGAG